MIIFLFDGGYSIIGYVIRNMVNGEFVLKGVCCVVGCKKIVFFLIFGILFVIVGVILYFEMDCYI